jgi:imidazolonepropionase-like amidohydrolase
MSARFQPMVPQMFSTARRMHESGVIVALGTDRTFGASVHMELELLHEAGIPLADLLRIATLNGAIYLGLERELGSIEPGKRADMLLLEADPRRDVAAYRRITAVFKEGRYIDRSALDVPANRRRSVE